MQDKWQQLVQKFGALSGRERGMILVAIFAVAYQLADFVILQGQFQQVEQINQSIAAENRKLRDLSTEIRLLSLRAQDDPNKALRLEVEQARGQIQQLQRRLQAATSELISPRDMARFLEELLVQDRRLTLLNLQTLDVEPLVVAKEADAADAKAEPVLHRHGFEIEFSGGYLETLDYLEALETLPWQFFWDAVSYQVVDYPNSKVQLRLHTLSLSEDWIGV